MEKVLEHINSLGLGATARAYLTAAAKSNQTTTPAQYNKIVDRFAAKFRIDGENLKMSVPKSKAKTETED